MQPEHSEVAIDTLPMRHEVSAILSHKQWYCSFGSVASQCWDWGQERTAEGHKEIWRGVGVLFICVGVLVSQVCTSVRHY